MWVFLFFLVDHSSFITSRDLGLLLLYVKLQKYAYPIYIHIFVIVFYYYLVCPWYYLVCFLASFLLSFLITIPLTHTLLPKAPISLQLKSTKVTAVQSLLPPYLSSSFTLSLT